jgi:hypothetical protein
MLATTLHYHNFQSHRRASLTEQDINCSLNPSTLNLLIAFWILLLFLTCFALLFRCVKCSCCRALFVLEGFSLQTVFEIQRHTPRQALYEGVTFTFKTGSVLNRVVSQDHVVALSSLYSVTMEDNQFDTGPLWFADQFTSTIMYYNSLIDLCWRSYRHSGITAFDYKQT